MSDTSKGMELLLHTLLPSIIGKLKAVEADMGAVKERLAALEQAASAPKPKRTRKKKEEPEAPVTEQAESTTDYEAQLAHTPLDLPKEVAEGIYSLYELSTGDRLQNLTTYTDTAGNPYVNAVQISDELYGEAVKIIRENPAATPYDVARELKVPVIAACYIMVVEDYNEKHAAVNQDFVENEFIA